MIQPVGHRILIKTDEAALETEWGFDLGVDKKLEDASMISGELVAIGDQAWNAFGPDFSGEPWAKIGDRVMFAKYSGNVVIDPKTGEEYKLMNDEDITAIIKGDTEDE